MDGALVSQAHGQAGSQAVCQGHPCSPPPWAQAFFPWAQQSALGGLAHVGRWRLGGSRTLSPGLRPPCHFSASTGRRPGTATTARIQGCGAFSLPSPKLTGLRPGSQLPGQSMGASSCQESTPPSVLPAPHRWGMAPLLCSTLGSNISFWSLQTTARQGWGLIPFPLSYPWRLFQFPWSLRDQLK